MRRYPLIKKTLQNGSNTIKILGSGKSGNTHWAAGKIRHKTQSPLIKTILRNRFEIVKLLGSGGSGDTYLALDLDLPGQPYCVVKHFQPKDSHPDAVPIAKKLFAREAEVLYQLGNNHDQIPRLFAHFDENENFYLVQEFIDGHDLTEEIIPGQPLSENKVFNLLKDILEVLVFVHEHKIIHRDIKPQNLMRRHCDGKIVLIDFGSIKKMSAVGTNATIIIGTPGYMPSEQAKGKPKLSSDLYAVGMIGIQALTGLMPSQVQEDPNTGEIIWRDRAQVSDSLAEILDTMVRDRHTQRYQSAAEALAALTSTQVASTPSESAEEDANVDDDYFLPYKNFLLLLGIGLGTLTSLVLIVLIYTLFFTSTSLPNNPTQLKFKRLIERFVRVDIPINQSTNNRGVWGNEWAIAENPNKQITDGNMKKS